MGSGGGDPAHSTSTIAAEELTGSHVVTIDRYTKTKGLFNGGFFRSGTFAAGGHRWYIRYYPNGDATCDADWISLFLQLDQSDAPGVKARFTFSLLDSNGKPVHPYSTSWAYTFTSHCLQRGWPQFIKRKDLEKSACLCNDSFRVRCDITVLKETTREDTSTAATRFVAVPPPDMNQHLGRLLSGGEGADVMFEVDGETVAAHRNILAARSSVFKVELFGPTRANTAVCVWIEGMEAKVFKAMLHFVYTDSFLEVEDGETMAMAQHLLVAADRYDMERLKLMCEDKLCDNIDTSNVGTILSLAEQHSCHGLKKACLEFLMSGNNLKAAIVTGGLEHLTDSCPSFLKELIAKVTV